MITKKDCLNDTKRAIEMNKMMGSLMSELNDKADKMMDRADYEYDRQKDDQAERHFRNLDILKKMRKDTPLNDFAEVIKELLSPDELLTLNIYLSNN